MRREAAEESERYALITIVAIVEDGALYVEVEWNETIWRSRANSPHGPLMIKDELLLLIRGLDPGYRFYLVRKSQRFSAS